MLNLYHHQFYVRILLEHAPEDIISIINIINVIQDCQLSLT